MNTRKSNVVAAVPAATTVILLLVFALAGPATGQKQPAEPLYRADTVLVKPARGVGLERLAGLHGALGARVERTFAGIGDLQIVKLPRGLPVDRAIEHYRGSALVEYAEPDYEVNICASPNDPRFLDGSLYGMTAISAPAAWDFRTGADPVIVAVIDTGVRYNHEDLAANMWVNPCVSCPVNGVVYTNDIYGINAINNTGDPWDDHYHGTHVSGTIGAVGNNGSGVAGVCWRVRIMALKFLGSSGSGFNSDAIKCIDYAIAKGAQVMNNSWGGGGYSQALRDAIARARDAGIIFVAAAGNNNTDNDATPFYPASYDLDNIVAVAATDRNDLRASFSNFGDRTVELAAPGVNILSTYTNATDNAYGSLSGTSMAAPHVSGALALLRAQFPVMHYSDLIYRVLGNTDPLSSMAGRCFTEGRLNLYNALLFEPRPIAHFLISPKGGAPPLTVNFTDDSWGSITVRTLDFGDGSLPSIETTTTHTYNDVGDYYARLDVSGPTGNSTRTKRITVGYNYAESPDAFEWINTAELTAFALGDDAVTPAQSLPFTFSFYGQPQTTVYIGSNGLLLFGSNAGGTSFVNADMPNETAPNNIVCPYWDDLNPAVGGQIRFGVLGEAPNRVAVASWEGVPHFASATTTFSFQSLLYEGSNEIKLQYLEVQPQNTSLGGGRSATIGVENSTGVLASKHGYNTYSISNNFTAIRFVYNATTPPPPAPAPLPCSIACPANMVVPNAPGQCGAVVNFPAPTVTGDCGTGACVPASGSFFPVGVTPVTCTSSAGPTCSFSVTVRDTHAPTITCPAPVTVSTDSGNCYATGVRLGTPTVADNCSVGSVANNAPSQFPKGTTTVTWTATDASGNAATCSQTVTVVDNQNPAISCPKNVNVTTKECSAQVTYSAPKVEDNCPDATWICSPASGSSFPVGATSVMCSAADAAGNLASCSFTVTVKKTGNKACK
jgi:subtilisin family serine protease